METFEEILGWLFMVAGAVLWFRGRGARWERARMREQGDSMGFLTEEDWPSAWLNGVSEFVSILLLIIGIGAAISWRVALVFAVFCVVVLAVAILRDRRGDRSQLGALFHRRYESPDVTVKAEFRGAESPSRDRGRPELPPSPPRRPSG